MINIQNLLFRYQGGDFQLKIPQFQLEAGERVAIIGPSGSGKTTLLNIIAGIISADLGKVTVNNIKVDKLTDAQRRDFRITQIGFIFQDFQLLDYLTIFDNILHTYRITQALKLTNNVRERAHKLASQMNIAEKLPRYTNELSQGEQQRAAICRALLPHPKLILADEATGNLDPRNKGYILDSLFESVEQHDASLLAVTHDHDLLARFDRVVDFADFHHEALG